jgi:hypothetical protein
VFDLHRTPQLAAPTLLIVGDVVRLADSAEMVEQFAVPGPPLGSDSLLPGAMFQDVPLAGATPESR